MAQLRRGSPVVPSGQTHSKEPCGSIGRGRKWYGMVCCAEGGSALEIAQKRRAGAARGEHSGSPVPPTPTPPPAAPCRSVEAAGCWSAACGAAHAFVHINIAGGALIPGWRVGGGGWGVGAGRQRELRASFASSRKCRASLAPGQPANRLKTGRCSSRGPLVPYPCSPLAPHPLSLHAGAAAGHWALH